MVLSVGGDSPRQRARDQQADQAGAALQRRILERVISLDPEPEDLVGVLEQIVRKLGEPTGPARGIAALLVREWEDVQASPRSWEWLLSEAIRAGADEKPTKHRRKRENL